MISYEEVTNFSSEREYKSHYLNTTFSYPQTSLLTTLHLLSVLLKLLLSSFQIRIQSIAPQKYSCVIFCYLSPRVISFIGNQNFNYNFR